MSERNRTLVVSHDPGLVNQARGAIQVLGGPVTSAHSAEAATSELAEGDVGLVIAATQLPGQDGYEFCRALKDREEAPRVVLLHAHADATAARRSAEAGADATLGRPFAGADLAKLLEGLVGKRFFTGVDGSHEAFQWPRAVDSVVDPMTGVFPRSESDEIEVEIDPGESWASSVVSAAIRPLEDEELPADESSAVLESLGTGAYEPVDRTGNNDVPEGAFSTQELPAQNLEAFDESHPVSVPVSPTTTAHFKPISDPDASDDSDDSAPDPGKKKATTLVDASTSGFLPPIAPPLDTPPDVGIAVREELAKLTATDGALTELIQRSVASAVTEALKQVLPAVAAEAARLAQDGD